MIPSQPLLKLLHAVPNGAPSSQWRKTDKAVDAVLDNPDQGALELTELLLYGKPVYVEPER